MAERSVPIIAIGSVAPEVLARHAAGLGDQRTLGDVLSWLRTQRRPQWAP